MKRRLVVLTRYPAPGKTKTRMAPLLGGRGAAVLHRLLAERTVLACREACALHEAGLEIRFDGCSERGMRSWLCRDLSFRKQGRGDLGDRLYEAFEECFRDSCSQVVAVGTDCPDLDPGIVGKAFEALSSHDAVFGPAIDGGYYLVGLSRPAPALFRGIPWGSCEVLLKSIEAARREGLKTALLEPLRDIDRPDDFAHVPPEIADRVFGCGKRPAPALSVILPLRGETAGLENALRSAADPRAEIVVSSAQRREVLEQTCSMFGARLIVAGPHRASRLNAGALASSGGVLLFLHADTILPRGWGDEVLRLMALRGNALGAFPLRISGSGFPLRLMEGLIGFRTRVRRMPYGDQAMFMRRDFFFRRGGFAGMPLMEDYEFADHLASRPLVVASKPVVTSARRWEELGVARTAAVNQLVIAGYNAGVDTALLQGFYRRTRGAFPRGGPPGVSS